MALNQKTERPEITLVPVGMAGVFALKWKNEGEKEEVYPLLEMDLSGLSDGLDVILDSKVMYVGPLGALPNGKFARALSLLANNLSKAWCVVCVIPVSDQTKPYTIALLEIDRYFIKKNRALPKYFYDPEAINETMKKTWDHMG